MHRITAFSMRQRQRVLIFTWTLGAESGLAKAKYEAERLGVEDDLSDYQAEKVPTAERFWG